MGKESSHGTKEHTEFSRLGTSVALLFTRTYTGVPGVVAIHLGFGTVEDEPSF